MPSTHQTKKVRKGVRWAPSPIFREDEIFNNSEKWNCLAVVMKSLILFHPLLHKIIRCCGKMHCQPIQIICSRLRAVPSSYPSTCPSLVVPLDFRIVQGGDHVFSVVPNNTNSNNDGCFSYGNYTPGDAVNTWYPLFHLIHANDPILQMETLNLREVM